MTLKNPISDKLLPIIGDNNESARQKPSIQDPKSLPFFKDKDRSDNLKKYSKWTNKWFNENFDYSKHILYSSRMNFMSGEVQNINFIEVNVDANNMIVKNPPTTSEPINNTNPKNNAVKTIKIYSNHDISTKVKIKVEPPPTFKTKKQLSREKIFRHQEALLRSRRYATPSARLSANNKTPRSKKAQPNSNIVSLDFTTNFSNPSSVRGERRSGIFSPTTKTELYDSIEVPESSSIPFSNLKKKKRKMSNHPPGTVLLPHSLLSHEDYDPRDWKQETKLGMTLYINKNTGEVLTENPDPNANKTKAEALTSQLNNPLKLTKKKFLLRSESCRRLISEEEYNNNIVKKNESKSQLSKSMPQIRLKSVKEKDKEIDIEKENPRELLEKQQQSFEEEIVKEQISTNNFYGTGFMMYNNDDVKDMFNILNINDD